jgi:hypothetical protein
MDYVENNLTEKVCKTLSIKCLKIIQVSVVRKKEREGGTEKGML